MIKDQQGEREQTIVMHNLIQLSFLMLRHLLTLPVGAIWPRIISHAVGYSLLATTSR